MMTTSKNCHCTLSYAFSNSNEKQLGPNVLQQPVQLVTSQNIKNLTQNIPIFDKKLSETTN